MNENKQDPFMMFAKIDKLKESMKMKDIEKELKSTETFLNINDYRHISKTNILNNLKIKQINMIFSGIFSTVYSVLLTQDKTLILKCTNLREFSREADRKAAENEYLILHNFHHNMLVKVISREIAVDNSQYELLMENGGDNLWNIKHNREPRIDKHQIKFSEKEIKRWLGECICIGSFFEDHNIYYGDFKTGNFLIDPQTKKLHLCDFGTSIYFPNKKDFEKDYNHEELVKKLKGMSELYAPPEFLNAYYYNSHYFQKIDVYMMGIMFYELITLKSNSKLASIAHKRGNSKSYYSDFLKLLLSDLQTFGLKESLAALLYSMLQQNPSDRPSFNYLHECFQNVAYGDLVQKLRLNHNYQMNIEVDDQFQDLILIDDDKLVHTDKIRDKEINPQLEADFSKTNILSKNMLVGPFHTNLLYNNGGTRVYKLKTLANKEYVVKQICMQENDDKIQDEFSIQKELNHENVVQAIDLVFSPKRNWAEMLIEYGGVSLAEKLEDFHALPVDIILKYFSQCVAGLRHIESRGIFHGDLKPSNIVINPQDIAKIVDFGTSIRLTASQLISTSYEVYRKLKGWTPVYMPPEILQRLYHPSIFEKVDIYNFGMTFYQMLFRVSNHTLLEEMNLKRENADFHINFEDQIKKKYFKTDEHTKKFIPILAACLRREFKTRPTFKTVLSIMNDYNELTPSDIIHRLSSNLNIPTDRFYNPTQPLYVTKPISISGTPNAHRILRDDIPVIVTKKQHIQKRNCC